MKRINQIPRNIFIAGIIIDWLKKNLLDELENGTGKMKKKSRKLYWIIGILVVAAIIGGIVINRIVKQKASTASLQTQTIQKGNLIAIVGATGSVRANQSAIITWQTSGRVSFIQQSIGDMVVTGDTLAELAESSLSQNIILARADLVTAQRNLDNLLNSNAAQAQAQLSLANAQDAYNKALWNRKYSNTPNVTNQDQINAAMAAVTLAKDKVDKAQDYYDRFAENADTDPVKASALSNLSNAKIALENAQKTLKFYTEAPAQQDIVISDAQVAVAKANLDDALREWNRLKNGADPSDIDAAKARVSAIQATIDMARLTAPFGGTITDNGLMVGDLVTPGTVAFRIDDLSHMLVDVMIPEVDINSVKVGQDVNLTFDAIDNTQYQGKVTEVARVGVTSAGLVNFQVTIELLNPDAQVLPGMTAAVNIVVSNLTNIIVIPNRAVRMVDGKHVVYLMKNGVPTKVEIEIGASSDTMSELVSGNVKEGDILILNPSTDFSSFGSGRPPF
jgi:HlyD family secretion protein